MKTFQEIDLIEPVQRALADAKYTTPTPIQAQTIPAALDGRDVLGCAQTGTGKTAAFSVPILNQLGLQPRKAKPNYPLVLVLAPTRELAIQIEASFATYGMHLPIRSVLVYGGVKQGNQVRALNRGAHILVATPGRLLDLINQKHIYLKQLQGNKSQNARQHALEAFRKKRVTVLVATDVAARGIDIDGVSHVVNFDLPLEPEAYVHRIGRTGRAGAEGIAISFCSPAERSELRAIEKLIGQKVPLADGFKEPDASSFEEESSARRPKRASRRRRSPGLKRSDSQGSGSRHSESQWSGSQESSGQSSGTNRPAKKRSATKRPAKQRPDSSNSTSNTSGSVKGAGKAKPKRRRRRTKKSGQGGAKSS
ncbi:UNVERIFIED_CONTAM: hypothetical protein GTU68_034186 [Idotea baltica]|nr:hypothetical protein [Idotea baltica]